QSDSSQSDSGTQDTQSPTCTYNLSTIAGSGSVGKQDGKGDLARFNSPRGLFWSTAGHLIVADRSNHRIRKMTTDGTVSTLAGSGLGSDVGVKGKFAYPGGVFEKAGVIWIADASNDQVRKLSGGVISVVAGIGIQGNSD
ncbi:MAG TPA: hypothetical protein DCQ06_01640, partial [Myxococcales bacterium]|nr:hypothetical protein [Myxococcales bacterium]